MNTRILLAVAATVALSACAKDRKTAGADGFEFPLIKPGNRAVQVGSQGQPGHALPIASPARRNPGSDIFRQPDPTKRLPSIRPTPETGRAPNGSPRQPERAVSDAPPPDSDSGTIETPPSAPPGPGAPVAADTSTE